MPARLLLYFQMCEVIAAKWLNFLFPTMGYTAAVLRQAQSKRKAALEVCEQDEPPQKCTSEGSKSGFGNVHKFDGISSSSDDEEVGDLFASSESDKDVEVGYGEDFESAPREDIPSQKRHFDLDFNEVTSFGLSSDSDGSEVSSTSISSDSDHRAPHPQRRGDKRTTNGPNGHRSRKISSFRTSRIEKCGVSSSSASSLSSTPPATRASPKLPSDDSVSAIDSFPESDSFSDLEHLDLGAIDDKLSSSDDEQ